MAEKQININALGQAIDTTFGRSSTPQTASYSVKVALAGPNLLTVSYGAIVNFGTEREMIHAKQDHAVEARSVVKEVLKHVKETYKDLTDESITLTERSPVDSVEIVNMNPYNPKRTMLYRSKCLVEVG